MIPNKYAVTGTVTGNRLVIVLIINLEFTSIEEVEAHLQEGQIYKIVDPFPFSPPDADPNYIYNPYYDMIEEVIKYDSFPRPLSPEELSEQRIASLEETIDMLVLSALEV